MSAPYQTPQVAYFNQVFNGWKVGISQVVVHYMAMHVQDKWVLLTAKVDLLSSPQSVDAVDLIPTSVLRVGRVCHKLNAEELDLFKTNILLGKLSIQGIEYDLPQSQQLSIFSPMSSPEQTFFTQYLEVRSDGFFQPPQQINYAQVNDELRTGAIPFDGLSDLLSYYFDFGFATNGFLPQEQKITLSLQPPLYLDLQATSLSKNQLQITIWKQINYRRAKVAIALRLFPNPALHRRMQVANQIRWDKESNDFECGHVVLDIDDCTTAEIMLSVDNFSVSKHYLWDNEKSLNLRLAVYKRFDPELKRLKESLNPQPRHARDLECGIATLLHLLGATCITPPTTESPDIIVETPGKRVALVECTILVNDMRSKAGKLIHRRNSLAFHEDGTGTNVEVLALLVVGQPKNLIVDETDYLLQNKVLLITREDIDFALTNLDIPPNLDKIYIEKVEQLQRNLP